MIVRHLGHLLGDSLKSCLISLASCVRARQFDECRPQPPPRYANVGRLTAEGGLCGKAPRVWGKNDVTPVASIAVEGSSKVYSSRQYRTLARRVRDPQYEGPLYQQPCIRLAQGLRALRSSWPISSIALRESSRAPIMDAKP